MENSREFYAAAAQQRWLLPEEVFDVLCRHEPLGLFISGAPPRLPPTGALFLFDRRTCKRFRKDGHNWLTRKSGARIREDHVKLRVGGLPRVAAAHAHSADVAAFHRRTYHLAECDGAPKLADDLAALSLVHYRLCVRRDADARTVRREESARRARDDVALSLALAEPAPMDEDGLDDAELWASLLDDESPEPVAADAPGGRVAGAVDAARGVAHAECRLAREDRAAAAAPACRVADVAPAHVACQAHRKDRFLVALEAPLDLADEADPVLRAGERLAVRFAFDDGAEAVAPARLANAMCLRCELPGRACPGVATLDVVAAVAAGGLAPRPLSGASAGAVAWVGGRASPELVAADDAASSVSVTTAETAPTCDSDREDRPTKVRVLRPAPADAPSALPAMSAEGLAELDADALASLSEAELDAAVEQLMLRVVGQMSRLASNSSELLDELDAPDRHGLSLLHYCALYNLDSLIGALLDKGADANGRGLDTPLHLAAGGGHVGAARALLRGGGDPNARDARGDTPRRRALARGHAKVAAVLAEAEASDPGGYMVEGARAPRPDDDADVVTPGVSRAALLHTAFSSLSLHEKCALAIARNAPGDRPGGNRIVNATSIRINATVSTRDFDGASRTRRERSIRPQISRIDFDLTELESSEVWSGYPARWLISAQATGRSATTARRRRASAGPTSPSAPTTARPSPPRSRGARRASSPTATRRRSTSR